MKIVLAEYPIEKSPNTKKSIAALLLLLGIAHIDFAHAAALNAGDRLTISSGIVEPRYYTVIAGSYFGMDVYPNGELVAGERIALRQGTTGLVIGVTTPRGANHIGDPIVGDTNQIDAPWVFSSSTGSHYASTAVTGSTTSGLNMSGWRWTWNNQDILMNTGAWTPTNCALIPGCSGALQNGLAEFVWDGIYGHTYLLNYAATIPSGDPSGLGGIRYFLHLEGVVNPVPLPAAVWLFGSGLMGFLYFMRRRPVQ